MKRQRLTPQQAFAAMSAFLDRYHSRISGGGDLGALLGDLQINDQDGRPFDPAVWGDWLAAVEEVLEEHAGGERLATARTAR
jgi:hypothetical protein